jgi:MFS family permease
MTQRRWLRIIPVALIMYAISYVDRTNLNLALTPDISTMVKDLDMSDSMKGQSYGIFFLGYVLMQIPCGLWASRWSARKIISLCLIAWGLCAVACGLAQTFRQFEVARFCLGAAESGVFPAMLVLLADWFPRSERARANACWNLCQPVAIMFAALSTGALLGFLGWRKVIVLEGALPFIWLPVWWLVIRDHPRDANWISTEERERLEATLRAEAAAVEPPKELSFREKYCQLFVLLLIGINFFHNALAYGCMTFFTSTLKSADGPKLSALQYGMLFSLPYTLTAVLMVLVSRHSDKVNERRMHVAFTYVVSGLSLIVSVSLQSHFWWSYAFLCLSIPGPSVALAPFWAIPGETLPVGTRGAIMGLVNACGNLGGFVGPAFVGWLKGASGSVALPFAGLGAGILIAALLTFFLPKTKGLQPG